MRLKIQAAKGFLDMPHGRLAIETAKWQHKNADTLAAEAPWDEADPFRFVDGALMGPGIRVAGSAPGRKYS